eukprot:9108161-Alexandrium_andersonii.AAC.1
MGILDTACARTMHGAAWGEKFRKYLSDIGLSWETEDVNVSMRGVGGSVRCSVAYKWPVGFFGRPGEILS